MRIVFLAPAPRRLLCIVSMERPFDYACSSWYPNLTKKIKHRIKTNQNKCMCFGLQLDRLEHISHEEFERLNLICLTLVQLFGTKSWTHPSVLTIFIPLNTFKQFEKAFLK